jgi:hypothetical protein
MSYPTEGPSADEADRRITYCFKWNTRRKRPGVPLSEAEARARDAAGDEFTAVLPTPAGSSYPVLVTIVLEEQFPRGDVSR